MGRLKATAEHVWAQPVKVRVAVIVLLTFVAAIATLILVSAVVDLGFLGALAVFGGIGAFVLIFWSVITVASSNL